MIASRLNDVARDLISEAQRYSFVTLLTEARNLSARRDHLGEGQYQHSAAQIRERALDILKLNLFNFYQKDFLEHIERSDLSRALPSRVSSFILSALPASNMVNAAASTEFALYITAVQEALAKAEGMLAFAEAMKVEKYHVKDGFLPFRLLLPRKSFDNEFGKFGLKLNPFDRLFQGISELCVGERKSPNIVYISTTDPSFLLEWIPTAVLGLVAFYNPIMEAAEKTLNVINAVRGLSGKGIDEKYIKDLEEKLVAANQQAIKSAISDHIESLRTSVEEPRLHELKNEINIYCLQVVTEVARGARLNFGEEGDVEFDIGQDISAEAQDQFRSMLYHQQLLEHKLDVLLGNVGQSTVMVESSKILAQSENTQE